MPTLAVAANRLRTGPMSRAFRQLLVHTLVLASAAVASGCSGNSDVVDRLGDLAQEDQSLVNEYTVQQRNLGYQIQSTAAQDDALELCYEMCNRSAQSCILSSKVCDLSATHPKNEPLGARCDVTRERCRDHRKKVPRQCPCDVSAGTASSK